MSARRLSLIAGVLAMVLACQPKGPGKPQTALGADVAPLRAAFNADSGKVRIVVLVAPT